jgi:hypothetical protein
MTWILPKQLHTLACALDTEALTLGLNEQSQICAQSLFLRSKVTPARTWSLKWKRDSWTQLLSGRILKPSHGPSFTAAWISSLVAIRASHFQQPASASAPKTQGISGHLSQMELFGCDHESASLKTSKGISLWGCPTSSKTWQEWVTEQRGEYSARLKSALRTRESGCSSWPTPQTSDQNGAASSDRPAHRKQLRDVEHGLGLPAQANPSTDGSRQGLWLTPRANEPDSDPNFVARNADRQEHCRGSLGSQVKSWATPRAGKTTDENPETWAARQAKGDVATMPLTAQVKAWATPKASDPQHSGPNMRDSAGNYALPAQAVREQWATPIMGDSHLASTPEVAQKRIEEGKVTLSRQTVAEQWGTPTARDHKSGRGNEEREYKELTPMVERQQAGKLNPRWVSVLMNLPVFWVKP